MSRRRFLGSVASSGLAILVGACTSNDDVGSSEPATSVPRSEVTPAPEGGNAATFTQPEVLTSRDGTLEVVLRAEVAEIPWHDSTRYAFAYGGSTPGPTLSVRPGDRLVVRLENRLDEPTNLHTHGLHVSPTGDGDNIFVTVPPGEDRTYVYDIPSEHRSGLFWYHPHVHGSVARQVAAGLAGAIVVTDGVDDVAEIATASERIWVLSDPPIGSSSGVLEVDAMEQMAGREGDVVLVNGIEAPVVATTAGGLERWRVVNASASRYYRLSLDRHDLHVIASDGGRLPNPITVREVLLAPGERTELLITPTADGQYAVRALPYERGGMTMHMDGRRSAPQGEIILATMRVAGSAASAQLPVTLPVGDHSLPTATDRRIIELGMGGMMMGGGNMMSFTIDGRTFDPDRTDVEVIADVVEEWEIRNDTPMDHPFHLHVWPFWLLDGSETSGWKDTVNVPAGESVSLLVPLTRFTGRTVYHCHILDHEDLGMMGVIHVQPSQ